MQYIKLNYLNYFAVSIIIHILIIFGGSLFFPEKGIVIGKELKPNQQGIALSLLNVQPKTAVIENFIQPDNFIPQPDYEIAPVLPVEEKIVTAKKTDVKKIKPTSHSKPKEPEQPPTPSQNTYNEPELPLAAYTDNLSAKTAESPSISDMHDTTLAKNIYEAPVALNFGEDNGPCFKNRVNPAYPPRALRMGKEAQVTLRLTIGADGLLLKTEVAKSGGIDFDKAAIEAVQKSTFQAARHMGVPVASVGLLKIDFVIKRNNKGML